jgi:hypothetical protein
MDEGWTRWLLEKFGFPFQNVTNADLQKGNLKQQFDVIIFPDQPAQTITQGYRPGSMPDEYVGGLGDSGIGNLKQFATSGGTVLCLNHSSSFCIGSLGVPATNVLDNRIAAAGGEFAPQTESRPASAQPQTNGAERPASRRTGRGPSSDFYSPGSLLNVKLDLSSPLTRGLPESITIWSEQSPAFTSDQPSVATFPADGILESGWLLGGNLIANKSALIDAKLGEGHVVLFGMRPQYRAQSYQTFKLFFNSLVAYR